MQKGSSLKEAQQHIPLYSIVVVIQAEILTVTFECVAFFKILCHTHNMATHLYKAASLYQER